MESYFSLENNGISFKVSKKKKRDQQTAVFIKLIFMSYSDVISNITFKKEISVFQFLKDISLSQLRITLKGLFWKNFF